MNWMFICLAVMSYSLASTTNLNVLPVPQEKILKITMLPNGSSVMGRDTLLNAEDLTRELEQRLFKSYTGTGKMYSSIKIESGGEVVMGTQNAVKEAIEKAQQHTLNKLCLEKHKKLFENTSSKQQEKLRKQFPVLFQTNFD